MEDKAEFRAHGYTEEDLPKIIADSISDKKCFTAASETGELLCMFGMKDTIETCCVKLDRFNKVLLYMPIWFIGTTRLGKYHDVFIDKFKHSIEELQNLTFGLPLGNWLGADNSYRASCLHWLGFEFVKHEQVNNVPLMFYARNPSANPT
jgi:hypothetical protein